MAKKTSTPKRAAHAAKESPRQTSAPADEDVDPSAIADMLGALAALDDDQQAAFLQQFTDAECDQAGADTKASAVYREAKRAVLGVDATVAAYGPVIKYGPPRLRFLLEWITALGDAIATQESAQGTSGTRRTELQAATKEAHEARAELIDVLGKVSPKSGDDRTKLANAQGTIDTPENTSKALRALATLGSAWLKRTDGPSRALVQAHFLTQADVDAARRAATRLDRAQEGATKGFTAPRDTPTTNRIEGRVELELGELYDSLERGHAKNRLIPTLVLGPTLRRVLESRRKKPVQDPPGGGGGGGGGPPPA